MSDDRVCVAPSRSAASEGKSAFNKAGATSTWDSQQGLPAKTAILMGVYGNMIVNHGFFWVPRLQTDPYNPSIILLFSSIFLFKRPKFRHLGRGSLSRFVPVGTAHQRPACLAGMVSCLVPIPILYYCLGHLLTGEFARPHRYYAPGWITPRPLTFGPLGVFLQRPLVGKAFLGDGV